MTRIENFGIRIRAPWVADLLLSVAVAVGFFFLLRATPDIPGGDDGYRHVKFAWHLIRDPHGALADPWKVAYFWPKPMDAWFGYHFLLAPLTLLFGLITSAKVLAAAVNGALSFVLLATLRHLQVFCARMWIWFAIAGSGVVLYRSTLSRPFLLSVVLMLAVTYFTLRAKPLGVAAASAAHALSYSMFFMGLFAPVLCFLLRRDKASFKLAAAAFAGLIVGLACNPTAPENVRFGILDVFSTLGSGLRLTEELEPLSLAWINPSRPIFAIWLAGLVVALWPRKSEKLSAATQLLLAMSLTAFAASIRVGRLLDYFVPLAVLFTASALSPYILRTRRNRVDALAAATVMIAVCGFNVRGVYQALPESTAAGRFRGSAEYLARNGRDALVFNTQWEQYPFLYFWNSQSTYLAGIEPSMMFVHDRQRYWLWRHIANDEPVTCGEPRCTPQNSRSIPSTLPEFGASFLLLENDKNSRLSQILHASTGSAEVYRDDSCSVFRLESQVAARQMAKEGFPR